MSNQSTDVIDPIGGALPVGPLVVDGSALVAEPPGKGPPWKRAGDGKSRSKPPAWVRACHLRLVAATLGVAVQEPHPAATARLLRSGLGMTASSAAHGARGSAAASLWLWGRTTEDRQRPAGWGPSGRWLMLALRLLGWDELGGYRIDNVLTWDKRPRSPEDLRASPPGAVVVALGNDARLALEDAGVRPVATLHPANARKFRFRTIGLEGYARLLESDGVPRGPWFGQVLPSVPTSDLDTPYPDWMRRWPPHNKRAPEITRAREHEAPSETVIEARELYLSGEVASVKAAAAKVGLDQRRLGTTAGAEDWQGQRRRRLEARMEAVNEEVTRLAVTTSAASARSAARLALALEKATREIDPASTPKELAELTTTALAIAMRAAQAAGLEAGARSATSRVEVGVSRVEIVRTSDWRQPVDPGSVIEAEVVERAALPEPAEPERAPEGEAVKDGEATP